MYFRSTDREERMVAAAQFRDRVAHRALVRVFEPESNDPTNENDDIGFRVASLGSGGR